MLILGNSRIYKNIFVTSRVIIKEEFLLLNTKQSPIGAKVYCNLFLSTRIPQELPDEFVKSYFMTVQLLRKAIGYSSPPYTP